MIRNGENTLRHLLGPIQGMLEDASVTEVVCQQPREVGVERNGKWTWHNVDLDFMRLDAIGILAGSLLSKPFDPGHPITFTTLPDGQRCTLCRPPVTLPGTISMTIRIPSKEVRTVHDADFMDLVRTAETKNPGREQVDDDLLALYEAKDWSEFFSLAVISRKTIVATGAVGSGKTTLLKRLMQEIPTGERLVTIEDTDEFGSLANHRNRVSLFHGSSGITAEMLVECSLRQRPDRILMQELRAGAEAMAYLRAIASGHPGGLTTFHAEDGDPWTPLSIMVKTSEAGRNIPDDKLSLILKSLIDIVVFCKRDERGYRIPSVWFSLAEKT